MLLLTLSTALSQVYAHIAEAFRKDEVDDKGEEEEGWKENRRDYSLDQHTHTHQHTLT